jgi:hypothetical protein
MVPPWWRKSFSWLSLHWTQLAFLGGLWSNSRGRGNPAKEALRAAVHVCCGNNVVARLAQVHPHDSETGYRAFQAAGGELAYSRKLGDETWRWVAAHPVQAMQIWLRHLGEFYFPPLWMWLHSGLPDVTTPFRWIIVNVIAAKHT